MIQLLAELKGREFAGFEERLMEMEIPSWTIREDRVHHLVDLIGYFDSEEEGIKSYNSIRGQFPNLPERPAISPVLDRDWKEAYKDHFRPWFIGNLHWVPLWLKGQYPLPRGSRAVFLDPGMAFGTGNHETTRLCAARLVELAQEWESGLPERSVIDAGCGSGILAISAVKLGFGKVSGFDIDSEAVKVSQENAAANGVSAALTLRTCGLEEGLAHQTADLVVANILANVLSQNAAILLGSVNPGGRLVLSGIMAREVGDVKSIFESQARNLWGACDARSRIDGEWADVFISRPGRLPQRP
ncbi:MAG TPA: 50S ribosomal protein L11 methyltransferase [Opitutales bacterium]|nr:50S ribosomal protein L11 methyltransferase [Opitutales bacterium]